MAKYWAELNVNNIAVNKVWSPEDIEIPVDCVEITEDADVIGREWNGTGFMDVRTYIEKRRAEYPSMEDQLDMMYHDSINGTTTWKDAIEAVKTQFPE